MRSVRRGIVTAALALPLAFGATGVAAAGGGGETEASHTSFEAKKVAAGQDGAVVKSVSSEADDFKHKHKGHKKHHRDDGEARHGKHDGEARHGKHKEKSWAHFEKKKIAANSDGAVVWKVKSSAWDLEKG